MQGVLVQLVKNTRLIPNPTNQSCISAGDCTTLDSTWQFVKTEPALPVPPGTELTLSCPGDYTNRGGDKASCNDGRVVPTIMSPECHGE